MLPYVIIHKSFMSVNEGGGCKDKQVFFEGAFVKRPRPMTNREGMDMMLMSMLIVGRKCSKFVGPLRS